MHVGHTRFTAAAPGSKVFCRILTSGAGADWPLSRKFGTTIDRARDLMIRAGDMGLDPYGLSFHVGSQCMRPDAFRTAMDGVNRAIVKAGVVADIVDVGGGFPAIYPGMHPPPMMEYVQIIKECFEQMFVAQNARLWAEPGRALVAEAGSVVVRVELRKGDALYLNDGAYGNLFDATHANWPFPVKLLRPQASKAKLAPFRFFGPTCDSIDTANTTFMLPVDIREGDLVRGQFHHAGEG